MNEYNTLKKYMMRFSVEDLKCFLDDTLLESLLEWQKEHESLFTKSRLSELIITIHGINILKNKSFRLNLIKKFRPEVILEFKDVLPSKYKYISDIEQIVKLISDSPWKKSDISQKLLDLLGFETTYVFDEKTNNTTSSNIITSHDKFFELLDYQYLIRQKALTKLTATNELKRMLIHMPTGTGKTKTATHIICHHYNYNLKKQGLIIWIAHTNELLQQAYDTFTSVWKNIGNGEIKTYKLWGDYEIDENIEDLSGFLVCGIQKLCSIQNSNSKLFKKIQKEASLIVYDEAHRVAKETRKVINELMIKKENMQDRSLIGLSATPGKSTGISFDNDLLVSMFGNFKIEIDPKLMNLINYSQQIAINMDPITDIISYFQERNVLAKLEKEELEYNYQITDAELEKIRVQATENGYNDFSKETLELIGRNKSRNLKILQRLIELNNDNIPTIVFACSVKHAQLLSAMLKLGNINNALIIGNMPPQERSYYIKRFKDKTDNLNIIINYEVLTTGFDATNIKCVFIARPTQSIVLYSQMIGRGLRGPQMGGNETCLLIDIKDNLSQYNENMAFSHFNNYWRGV